MARYFATQEMIMFNEKKKKSALQSSDGMDSTPYPGISKSNKSPLFTGQDMKSIYNSNHRTCASPTRVCVHVCGKERRHRCTCKYICVVWIKKLLCADLGTGLCFLRPLAIKVRICALVTPDI